MFFVHPSPLSPLLICGDPDKLVHLVETTDLLLPHSQHSGHRICQPVRFTRRCRLPSPRLGPLYPLITFRIMERPLRQ